MNDVWPEDLPKEVEELGAEAVDYFVDMACRLEYLAGFSRSRADAEAVARTIAKFCRSDIEVVT